MKFTNEEVEVKYELPGCEDIAAILTRIGATAEDAVVSLIVNNVVSDTVTVEGVTLEEGEAEKLFNFCQEFRKLNPDVKWNVMTINLTKESGEVELTVAYDEAKFEETKEVLEQEEAAPATEGDDCSVGDDTCDEGEGAAKPADGEAAPAGGEGTQEYVDPNAGSGDPNEPKAAEPPAEAEPVELPVTIETPEPTNMYRCAVANLYGANGMVAVRRRVNGSLKVSDKVKLNGKQIRITGTVKAKAGLESFSAYTGLVSDFDARIAAIASKELKAYLTDRFGKPTDAKITGVKSVAVTGKTTVIGIQVDGCANEVIGIKLVNDKVSEIDTLSKIR